MIYNLCLYVCICCLCSFVRPEILEQLVKMITLEPEEDAEDKVKFKSVNTHFTCIATCVYSLLCGPVDTMRRGYSWGT